MLKDPTQKYRPYVPVNLPNRQWPMKTIQAPPLWMSTDLRDGNQSLFEPMDGNRKLRMFQLLIDIGVKEIEVAFPSASETDFSFVRHLIEESLIPQDITVGILTQAREELIDRSVESLLGCPRAFVHLYNAIAPEFREVVFGLDRKGVIDLAVRSAEQIKRLTEQEPNTKWTFEYSPEAFSGAELDFALEISEAVIDVWAPTPNNKMILNLPATVECATPNHFADQIEWMHNRLTRRDAIVLSVHPHNDRGAAIAAAELAVMAGADRVEGCLFGNGERTGNVDLVTLALNLYTQGVDPGLDFSNIDEIARIASSCTQLPIHPRHPYVGDLVHTAFSGSHQDAIKKGLAAHSSNDFWKVPYLPIDPKDIGRTYESVIRVNSQSGKGGISYLLEAVHHISLPRRMLIEFSGVVQSKVDAEGTEITSSELWDLFHAEYLDIDSPLLLISHQVTEMPGGTTSLRATVRINGTDHQLEGSGTGPVDALSQALGLPLEVIFLEQRSIGKGTDAKAITYIALEDEGKGQRYGAGIDANTTTATLRALVSAANRACLSQSFDIKDLNTTPRVAAVG